MTLEEKYNIFGLFNILEGDEFGEKYLKLLKNIFIDKNGDEKLKKSGPITEFLKNFYISKDSSKTVFLNPLSPQMNNGPGFSGAYSVAPSAPPDSDLDKNSKDKNSKDDKNSNDGKDDKNDIISWIKSHIWLVCIIVFSIVIFLIIVIIIVLSTKKNK